MDSNSNCLGFCISSIFISEPEPGNDPTLVGKYLLYIKSIKLLLTQDSSQKGYLISVTIKILETSPGMKPRLHFTLSF